MAGRRGLSLIEMLMVTAIMGVVGLAITNMLAAQVRTRVQASNRSIVYKELTSSLFTMSQYLQSAQPSTTNEGSPDELTINVRSRSPDPALGWISIEVRFAFESVGNKVLLMADLDNDLTTEPETLLGGCPANPSAVPPCPAGGGNVVSPGYCPIQLLRGTFAYYSNKMEPNDSDGDGVNDFGNTQSPVIEMSVTGAAPVTRSTNDTLVCDTDCFTDPDLCAIRTVRTMVYAWELQGLQGGGRAF